MTHTGQRKVGLWKQEQHCKGSGDQPFSLVMHVSFLGFGFMSREGFDDDLLGSVLLLSLLMDKMLLLVVLIMHGSTGEFLLSSGLLGLPSQR